MKVLFINNYPMDKAWRDWEKCEYPAHHLWGITHLSRHGIECDILAYERYSLLDKIGKSFKISYLDQQVRVFFKAFKYDVIYSACGNNTFFLALLRALGLIRTPVIALIHHPVYLSPFRKKLFAAGHDKFMCLSERVVKQLREDLNVTEDKICLVNWGPDLTFYERHHEGGNSGETPFIISAGKSHRDHDTLAKAFAAVDCHLKIYCSEKSAPSNDDLPTNVEVIFNHPEQNAISYLELLPEYRNALAVAIPLEDAGVLLGLTSLLDAMAMGKPVVMTRNRFIDIDIEKEGFGLWVEPGDVEGWKSSLSYLLSNPERARAMGERGYRLVKTRYNIENFTSQLAKVLQDIR